MKEDSFEKLINNLTYQSELLLELDTDISNKLKERQIIKTNLKIVKDKLSKAKLNKEQDEIYTKLLENCIRDAIISSLL